MSVASERLAAGWAEDSDEIILRRCPVCEQDSIVGHGRRRKQAHDEHHDWIGIRRGRCVGCGTTYTFLPIFSLPYTHYSLLARCQALLRRFEEHCSWEKALPKLQTLIDCRIRPLSGDGRAAWTVLIRRLPFSARLFPA